MIIWTYYLAWLADTSRDNHRVMLADIDYSDKEIVAGHGRTNFRATLNEVTAMQVRVFTDGSLELTFTQPTSQENYSWEVWRNGEVVLTTQGGVYNMSSTVRGETYQFAVASVIDPAYQYSKPWIVEFTKVGGVILQGALGDWNDVGVGSGASGSGTIHLSSYPWVSDEFVSYDNFITTDPEFEKSIYNFGGIGDFRATNQLADELDWKELYWQGHTCNFYHGDEDWPRDDFWQIGSAMVNDFRMVSPTIYQYDLVDGSKILNRNFQLNSLYADTNVETAFDVIATLENLGYINVFDITPEKKSMAVSIRNYAQTTKTVGNALRVLANSVNLYLTTWDGGSIRIINKDPSALINNTRKSTLSGDEIVDDEMLMISTIAAARKVVLELDDGTTVTGSTTASTGDLEETVTIKTMLLNEEDATVILEEYVDYYSKPHPVWQIGVLEMAGQFTLGDLVTVDHYLLQDTGVVTRIKYSPMSSFYTIDLEII